MTDPRRLAHAINPRPFAHPVNRDDPLGPSILKEAEAERQELIRRAEGVLVELQAENARLREALERLSTSECFGGGEILGMQLSSDPFGREIIARMGLARAALNATGPVVLATPDVVKTMVKEAREKALEDAARQFTKDETYTGCVVLHRLEKLRGRAMVDWAKEIDACPHCGLRGGTYFTAGHRVRCLCQDPSTSESADRDEERRKGVALWNNRAMPTSAKPLEWVRADGHLDADICDTFGLYQIADGGVLFIGHSGDGVDHGTQEAAKAAAQVDFDQRISALQPAHRGVAEAARVLLETIERHGDWDDGCFYYCGTSASELQSPMATLRRALSSPEGE